MCGDLSEKAAPRRAAILLCVLSLLALSGPGCLRRELTWELALEDPERRADVVRLNSVILRGGCEGYEVIYWEDFAPGGSGPQPPELEVGVYGFVGAAFDASCTIIAMGCQDVEVPRDRVTVVLRSVSSPFPECSEPQCEDGYCRPFDCSDCRSPQLCRAGYCDPGCGDGYCPETTICCEGETPSCCPLSCSESSDAGSPCTAPLEIP